MIADEEVREAGEHLIAHGGDCIRRGKALLNLYATRVSGAAKTAKAL